MINVSTMDGIAQAELVRRGDVTAVELAEAAIANIERINPRLNAVIYTMYDRARTLEDNGPLGLAVLAKGPAG